MKRVDQAIKAKKLNEAMPDMSKSDTADLGSMQDKLGQVGKKSTGTELQDAQKQMEEWRGKQNAANEAVKKLQVKLRATKTEEERDTVERAILAEEEKERKAKKEADGFRDEIIKDLAEDKASFKDTSKDGQGAKSAVEAEDGPADSSRRSDQPGSTSNENLSADEFKPGTGANENFNPPKTGWPGEEPVNPPANEQIAELKAPTGGSEPSRVNENLEPVTEVGAPTGGSEPSRVNENLEPVTEVSAPTGGSEPGRVNDNLEPVAEVGAPAGGSEPGRVNENLEPVAEVGAPAGGSEHGRVNENLEPVAEVGAPPGGSEPSRVNENLEPIAETGQVGTDGKPADSSKTPSTLEQIEKTAKDAWEGTKETASNAWDWAKEKAGQISEAFENRADVKASVAGSQPSDAKAPSLPIDSPSTQALKAEMNHAKGAAEALRTYQTDPEGAASSEMRANSIERQLSKIDKLPSDQREQARANLAHNVEKNNGTAYQAPKDAVQKFDSSKIDFSTQKSASGEPLVEWESASGPTKGQKFYSTEKYLNDLATGKTPDFKELYPASSNPIGTEAKNIFSPSSTGGLSTGVSNSPVGSALSNPEFRNYDIPAGAKAYTGRDGRVWYEKDVWCTSCGGGGQWVPGNPKLATKKVSSIQ